MKGVVSVLLLTLVPGFAFSDAKADFYARWREGKVNEAFEVIKKWETSDPNDLELMIAEYNYYFFKSRLQVVDMSKEVAGPGLTVTDGNNRVGTLKEGTLFESDLVKKAVAYLDRAIEIDPTRLDVYWGKVLTFTQTGDYKSAGAALKFCLDVAVKNGNVWRFQDKVLNNDVDFFVDSVQDYYQSWFDSGTVEGANSMVTCNLSQILLFPNNVIAYLNLARYYRNSDEELSMGYYLAVDRLDSTFDESLINLGLLYKKAGKTDQAREYFRRASLLRDNDRAVQFARTQLASLDN